jgi:hypothetical protein
MAYVFAVGCGSHDEPRAPQASQHRCTLRISQHGTLADGTRMSRADAVAHCKGSPGGAVVVIDDSPRSEWDETTRTIIVIEDKVTRAEWEQTRTALQRAGVRIYVREPLCYDPDPYGCRPRPPATRWQPGPRRENVIDTPVATPPAPDPSK